mmetsp:Transcript_18367/g.50537  ORF Transcript_18367/g.50537 Transcript_18367/m.50537 type:complete len:231 (+) Transcript_18367:2049-2741(+)
MRLEGVNDGDQHANHKERNRVGHRRQESLQEAKEHAPNCQCAKEEQQREVLVMHLVRPLGRLQLMLLLLGRASAPHAILRGLQRIPEEVGADGCGDVTPLCQCLALCVSVPRLLCRFFDRVGCWDDWLVRRSVHDHRHIRRGLPTSGREAQVALHALLQQRYRNSPHIFSNLRRPYSLRLKGQAHQGGNKGRHGAHDPRDCTAHLLKRHEECWVPNRVHTSWYGVVRGVT